jgi:hypothetical protein
MLSTARTIRRPDGCTGDEIVVGGLVVRESSKNISRGYGPEDGEMGNVQIHMLLMSRASSASMTRGPRGWLEGNAVLLFRSLNT